MLSNIVPLNPPVAQSALDRTEVRCYPAGQPHRGYLATLGSLIDANRGTLTAMQVLGLYGLRTLGNTAVVSLKVGQSETLVERADARRA